MKLKFLALAMITVLVSVSHADSDYVKECNLKSMYGLLDKGIRTYVQRTLLESYVQQVPNDPFTMPTGNKMAVVVDAKDIAIKYMGLSMVQDDHLSKPISQHIVQVSVRVKGTNTVLALMTATRVLETSFRLAIPQHVSFAFPDPQIVDTRDKLGNILARNCVLSSHAGANRFAIFVNRPKGDYVILHDLISKGTPILATAGMLVPRQNVRTQ